MLFSECSFSDPDGTPTLRGYLRYRDGVLVPASSGCDIAHAHAEGPVGLWLKRPRREAELFPHVSHLPSGFWCHHRIPASVSF